MMRLPPHVAVIYDPVKLVPLRFYVNEDHEDGQHMFTIKPGHGEAVAVISKQEVRGLSLQDIARKAILKRIGISF